MIQKISKKGLCNLYVAMIKLAQRDISLYKKQLAKKGVADNETYRNYITARYFLDNAEQLGQDLPELIYFMENFNG